jgi:hypothetical protein
MSGNAGASLGEDNGADYGAVADAVFSWSRDYDFRGHNKHDGLNSPILSALLGWSKWPRIVAVQIVTRSPVNLRSPLLVPRTLNPKGLALFVQGALDRYRSTQQQMWLDEALGLLDLLTSISSSQSYSGTAWGYDYPWQDPGFFAPRGTPNAVVTAFVCEAFLDAYEITGEAKLLETVDSAIQFFVNDLTVLKDEPDELCLSYMPMPMSMRVMDVSILIASVLARSKQAGGRGADFVPVAERLLSYVMARQTSNHAWFYTDPPEDSLITHDNYHTGFILDALWRYMHATDDWAWMDQYRHGLEFYRARLFSDEGAPRWMHNKEYPYDIHGAAQGVLTFARHQQEYPGFATKVAAWAMNNMYHADGRFYYQKNRWRTKRFTLMRWCNAWMFKALANLSLSLGESTRA